MTTPPSKSAGDDLAENGSSPALPPERMRQVVNLRTGETVDCRCDYAEQQISTLSRQLRDLFEATDNCPAPELLAALERALSHLDEVCDEADGINEGEVEPARRWMAEVRTTLLARLRSEPRDVGGGTPDLLDQMLVAVTEQHPAPMDVSDDDYHFCDEWECDWRYGLRALNDHHKAAIAELIRAYKSGATPDKMAP